MIVDEMQEENPELLKDIHWGEPVVLPYTKETDHYRKEEPKGSAEVKEEADNVSNTYYKLAYPFRASMSRQKRPSDPITMHCRMISLCNLGVFQRPTGRWSLLQNTKALTQPWSAGGRRRSGSLR